MELLRVVLIIISLIVLVRLMKPVYSDNYKNSSVGSVVPASVDKPSVDKAPTDKAPTDKAPSLGPFPIPQSTTQEVNLSGSTGVDLTLISSDIVSNEQTVSEVRTKDCQLREKSHFPEFYLKDTLSGNTIGTSEYKFAEVDNEQPEYAWSDENVSQYPKYYSADVVSQLTNVGSFFDQNNQYVDLTGSRSEASIDDVCYTSKAGEKVCLENNKLHNVPPSLITDVQSCGFLNSIGLLEYSNRVNETGEKVMNGGALYDGVKGSRGVPSFSRVMKQPTLKCTI